MSSPTISRDQRAIAWIKRQLGNPHVVVGAVVLLGTAVRFAGLDLQSYDHDESVTASQILHPSFGATLDAIVRLERSPPLYYVVAWLWSKLFGTGEVGLRSLSALIGACTIAAAYWTSGQFGMPQRSRIVATGLIALSPYLVWYSQEARSYALVVLWEVIALGLFERWLRQPSRKRGLAWAGVSALALCAHYFAVFLIAPQVLLAVLRIRPRRQIVAPVTAIGAAGLALVPLALAQQGGGRTDSFAHQALLDRAATSFVDFFAGEDPPFPTGGERPHALLIVAAVLAVAVLVWTLGRVWRSREQAVRTPSLDLGLIAAASFGLPLLLAVVGIDFFKYHNLIGTVAPMLLLFALVLGRPGAGRLSLALIALVLVFSAVVLAATERDRDLQRPDWRGVAQAIGTAPRQRLIFSSAVAGTPLRYYLRQGRELAPSARKRCLDVGQVVVITDRPDIEASSFNHLLYSLVATRKLVEPFTLYRLKARWSCARPDDFLGFVRDEGYALLVPPGGPAPRR